MNKDLRGRAEALLIFQDCDLPTDRQTARHAAIIAHHDKKFQVIGKPWNDYWDWASKAMREKFPNCPCRACKRSRNEPEG